MSEAEWRKQPGPWAHMTKEQADAMIDAAVRAEREACASEMDRRADKVANTADTRAAYRNAARAIRTRS